MSFDSEQSFKWLRASERDSFENCLQYGSADVYVTLSDL